MGDNVITNTDTNTTENTNTNTSTQIQSILFDRGDDAVAAEEAGGVRTLEDSHQITWVATLSKNT